MSMIEHDSCKETTSLKTELRVIQRKYDSVVKKLKKMEQERAEELANNEDDMNEDGTEEKERECEVIKQKYEDIVKEV